MKVNGLTPSLSVGSPEVYQTGVMFSVPAGFRAEAVIVDQKTEALNGVRIQAAALRFRCGGGSKDIETLDMSTYGTDGAWFPAQPIAIEDVGMFQDVKLQRVAINPVRTNPAIESLEISTELKVRVNFVRDNSKSSDPTTRLSATSKRFIQTVAANADDVLKFNRDNRAPETLLVVTADSLAESLEPLIAWKRARGLKVDVVTFTKAGGTKEKLKTWIQSYYDAATPKPTYVLFAGNKTTLPPFFASTSSGDAATDINYVQLTGSDAVPDLFYGRLVADNAKEAGVQISRWIAYERDASANDTWYPNGGVIASNEGDSPSDEEYAKGIETILKANTYDNVSRHFYGAKTATPAKIIESVNNGRSWLSYFGHGSGEAWASTNGYFENTHVFQLKNTDKLPFIMDVSCENGGYDHFSTCFAKAWVTHTSDGKNAGAVGMYSGTVSVSWHPPAIMSTGATKAHFEKPVHSLGGTVLAGQLYLLEKSGVNANTIDNLEWYTLFGDPSMNARTDVPGAIDVEHEVRNSTVIVTAKSGGSPAAGLTVSVSRAGQSPVAVGTTDSEGVATLSVDESKMDGSTLTVTGYNKAAVTQSL